MGQNEPRLLIDASKWVKVGYGIKKVKMDQNAYQYVTRLHKLSTKVSMTLNLVAGLRSKRQVSIKHGIHCTPYSIQIGTFASVKEIKFSILKGPSKNWFSSSCIEIDKVTSWNMWKKIGEIVIRKPVLMQFDHYSVFRFQINYVNLTLTLFCWNFSVICRMILTQNF